MQATSPHPSCSDPTISSYLEEKIYHHGAKGRTLAEAISVGAYCLRESVGGIEVYPILQAIPARATVYIDAAFGILSWNEYVDAVISRPENMHPFGQTSAEKREMDARSKHILDTVISRRNRRNNPMAKRRKRK